MSYLIDTNVLGRLIQKTHPMHAEAMRAVRTLRQRDERLCIVPQNLIEFWAIATRPVSSNGLGLSLDAAGRELRRFKKLFSLNPDTPTTYARWEGLVMKYGVMGKSVHDARLVAAMLEHGLTHALTFNADDFTRFSGVITVVTPAQVQ
jgi:predicted nucleic acid-binding protein